VGKNQPVWIRHDATHLGTENFKENEWKKREGKKTDPPSESESESSLDDDFLFFVFDLSTYMYHTSYVFV